MNLNELNPPIKRHRVDEWIKATPIYMLPKETHFSFKGTYRLKVKEWKKYIPRK